MKRTAANVSDSSAKSFNRRPSKLAKDVDEMETRFQNATQLYDDIDLSFLDHVISNRDTILPAMNDVNEEKLVVTPPLNYPKLDNQLITMVDLGLSLFLRAELFRKEVKIHLRHYVKGENFNLFPTKKGICMDLYTWYRFCKKLYTFNLNYNATSFVANNKLLVLNQEGEMIIQRLDTFQHIALCEFQLKTLKRELQDFNEKVLSFMYELYLPALVASKRPPIVDCSEDSWTLLARIIASIESEISISIFKREYICESCIEDRSNQLEHSCLNESDLTKFHAIGDSCLLIVNFNTVVDIFLQNTPTVSVAFLQNFDLKSMCDLLFKIYEDV